jgi:hypothetical protein
MDAFWAKDSHLGNMYLALWVRLWGTLARLHFNLWIVK